MKELSRTKFIELHLGGRCPGGLNPDTGVFEPLDQWRKKNPLERERLEAGHWGIVFRSAFEGKSKRE